MGKRILLVGKETFIYPFYFLADKWSRDNQVAVFWVNQSETELAECDLNRSTYFLFRKKENIRHYTLHQATEAFGEQYDNIDVKGVGIEAIESKYSYFKRINCQLISDQFMSWCYHYRDLNQPPTYAQQLLWIKCVYVNVEDMLDDFKPDVIFDCDIAELPRTVLNEVAKNRGIPYISIAYSRYEMYKIPSYQLSQGVEQYFIDEFEKCLQLDNKDEIVYVKKFREKSSIKNLTYMVAGNPTYSYRIEPLIDTLKNIYSRVIYFWKQDRAGYNKQLKKSNPVLFCDSEKYMKFWIRDRLFRRKLYKTRTLFEDPAEEDSYVYMPLHLIPESTTFSMAPFWINELSAVEAVSKSLPAGWYLYVKEHQSMLGERGLDFYNRVKKIPNVKLVQFNYYDDPKPWIEKAKAVVTITGTAAYEAVLLGKPAFVFGDVPFEIIKGVTRIRNIEELPAMLGKLEVIDNLEECAAYIKAVKNVGKSINLNYIMNEAFANLVAAKDLEAEFFEELENLKIFFEEAYERVRG